MRLADFSRCAVNIWDGRQLGAGATVSQPLGSAKDPQHFGKVNGAEPECYWWLNEAIGLEARFFDLTVLDLARSNSY